MEKFGIEASKCKSSNFVFIDLNLGTKFAKYIDDYKKCYIILLLHHASKIK